jgi:hypothetical protein
VTGRDRHSDPTAYRKGLCCARPLRPSAPPFLCLLCFIVRIARCLLLHHRARFMANPRQRRKTRSSHKPVHQSRQAKKLLKKQPRALGFLIDMSALPTPILIFDIHQAIRGPKGLQEAWDKHKTVRQKYVYTIRDMECLIMIIIDA